MTQYPEYHKINSLFKRSPNGREMLFGVFSTQEFAYLKDNQWTFTEKIDGTNIRVGFDGTTVTFLGKTYKDQIHPKLQERLEEMFPVERLLETFGSWATIVLYGEGYGPKIQGGGARFPQHGFALFDVQIGSVWLSRKYVEHVASKLRLDPMLGLVPLKGQGTLIEMAAAVEQGLPSIMGDFQAEGLVARPCVEVKDHAGGRIITKLKTKDFKGRVNQ